MPLQDRLPSPWVWLAAAIAFSPAILELAHQIGTPPRTFTPLVAATLLAAAWLQDGRPESRVRWQAVLLLAAASSLELLGILTDASTLGRASLPLAVIGLSRLLGRPSLAVALLSLWLVPIPISLMELMRTPLEHGAAWVVAAVARLGDAEAVAVGPLVRAHGAALELKSTDAGLHLAHLLALLGFFAGVLRPEALGSVVRRAAVAALLAVPLQPLFLAAAAFVLLGAGPAAARGLLDIGLPALAVLTGVWWAERGSRRA